MNSSQPEDILEDIYSNSHTELMEEFAEYGHTPPRTRLKIKNRDWDRRQKSCVNYIHLISQTNNFLFKF